MRIKTLRFKNLASLAGEWELDLTHPAFAANGLFAITGQTGAGKSTILDAICLALYGQTPRLNKIGLKSNEIMSRHHADCFAEVVFETKAGRYLCRWSQARKGKSPTGELAPSKHILQELDAAQQDVSLPDDQRSSDRKTEVLARVEELTGLDFTRFTRSMLLAQGDFAAFLNAKPTERALLLERITGTELYADISRRTSERASAEEKMLALLTAELNGLVPLTDEEKTRLTQQLTALTETGKALGTKQKQVQNALHWLERHAELVTGKIALAASRTALAAQRLTREPLTRRLALSKAALELEAAHTALAARRVGLTHAKEALTTAQIRLPELEKQERAAQETVVTAEAALTTATTAQREAAPLLTTVRQLDTSLRERQNAQTQNEQAASARTVALEALRKEQAAGTAARARHQTERQTLLQALHDTAAQEALPGLLSGFRAETDNLKTLYTQRDELHKALQTAQATESRHTKDVAAAKLSLENRQKAAIPADTQLTTSRAELIRLLDGKDPAHWRQAQQHLTEQGTRLRSVTEHLAALLADQTENAGLAAALAAQAPQQAELAESLRVDAVLVPQLEARRELLDRIRTLEDHRARLEAGQPCPLCGSEQHPYAVQTPPPPDTVLAELAAARIRQEQNRKTLHELERDQTARTTTITQLNTRMQATRKALDAVLQEFGDAVPDALQAHRAKNPEKGSVVTAEQVHEAETALAATREYFLTVRDRVKGLDDLETAIRNLTALSEAGKESVRAAERTLLDAQTALDGAVKERQRLHTELDAHGKHCATAVATLETAVLHTVPAMTDFFLRLSAGDATALESLLLQLTQLAALRTERTAQLTALEPKLAALDAELEQRAKTMESERQGLEADRKRLDEARTALTALAQERRSLFGEKLPDAEATQHEQTVATARTALHTATTTKETATRELSRQKALLDEAQRAASTHTTAVESEESAFHARLAPTPFGDEAAFLAARLPEAERLLLETQEAALHAEQARQDAREADLTAMESKLTEELTDPALQAWLPELAKLPELAASPELAEQNPATRATLLATRQELEQQRTDIDRETGGLSLRLDNDAQLRQSRAARLATMTAQQETVTRWSRLNALIGTKNGNAYRTFAQGLTFAALTEHANIQLRTMTDRYTLLPHPDESLSLAVVDLYQAGEVRSAANLSGGETFMVSLALALGLSGMVSRKTGVESLFLDEGFGTLDPEALDMALNTLASLRHEGKLICVISHVPALQERMSLHIEVRAGNAGRSELSGPGVRAVPQSTEKNTRKQDKAKEIQ